MSETEEHPAKAMAKMDLDDVEIEDDDVHEKSMDELTKEYGQEARDVAGEIDLTSDPAIGGGSDLEESDVSPGGSVDVPTNEVSDDESLIKRTGMARFDVDSGPTEDEKALAELSKAEQAGEEVEAGLREDFDTQSYVTDTFAKAHGEDSGEVVEDVSEMNKADQAEHLAEQIAESVDVDKIAKRAANLPKTTEQSKEAAEQAVYEEITKFAKTMYSEGEIAKDALEAVRDRFATRAGRVAKALSAA